MSETVLDGPGYLDVDDLGRLVTSEPRDGGLEPLVEVRSASACWSFGPLDICASASLAQVEAEVTLLGQRIGRVHLSPERTEARLGADVGIAKAGVRLTADFTAETLRAQGEVCRRRFSGGWRCAAFDSVILRW